MQNLAYPQDSPTGQSPPCHSIQPTGISFHNHSGTLRTNLDIKTITEFQSQIRVCGINVCGLNSKLENGVFYDYIKQFDILCITESKVRSGTPITNFRVFDLENNSKRYPLPGICGLHIYVQII